ncbi:MAG: CRISPR-associated endonuclease Cas2 [Candidatus Aminicenantes bacterium]|nr:CRISPR-associated endonuclease Cas2 [Candidatus Aminicenantes bacterium]
MKIYYLICYDIKDDFRLHKIFRYMKGKGVHLQYSVFHCYLNRQELLTIIREIKSIINEKEDDVRIYPLITNFETIVLGQGARIPEGLDFFFD